MIAHRYFASERAKHDARFASFPDYPLLLRTVRGIKSRLPSHIEFDDLFQVGAVALLKARRAFDGRGTFDGYAGLQIRRAILDEFRRLPGARARAKRGVGPDVQITHETADGLPGEDLTPELTWEDLQRRGLLSLEDPPPDHLLRVRLSEALASLTPREQRVIVGMYYEDRRLEDLAPLLGICASRVSQLHTRAIRRLRERLKEAA